MSYTYTPWGLARTNMIPQPQAPGTAVPSGWTVGGTGAASGGWVTNTAVSGEPYIFTSKASESIAIGDAIYGEIQVQSDSANISYVRVNVHRTTGNAYYTSQNAQVIVPTPTGVPVTVDLSWISTVASGANDLNISVVPCGSTGAFTVPPAGSVFRARSPILARTSGPYFDGDTTDDDLDLYGWTGPANASPSTQQTRSYVTTSGTLPPGTLPALNLTTQQILYGSRSTSYRYELLTHNADGTDSLSGYLDGVLTGGTANWQWNQAVKGSASIRVQDLAVAQPGMTRVGDVTLNTIRIRPVLVVDGLPEIPLGVFLVTSGPETWADTGRVFQLELHDRTTVLDQDQITTTFTADTATPIMTQIVNLIATAGEKFVADGTETRKLTNAAVWPVGTTKLQIVNDLLKALNYNSLTITGLGDFRATPYVRPAARTISYALLNGINRELIDGAMSIYQPDWNRDRDVYGVPNKVVTVGQGTGTTAPPTGSYSNTDPSSPFSYAARGRWIVSTITGVQTPSTGDPVAFLNALAQASLIAQSSPQATVTVKHLPLPLFPGDVMRFASTPAGIDKRHVVVGLQLELSPTGLMQSNLQELIDL